MERLPSNCVLDKGRTGCGATTLAIMQQGNTIITIPSPKSWRYWRATAMMCGTITSW